MTRPFVGIRQSQGPDPTYDAAIIGAGIGGLICANLMARAGLKVLMVEQHYMLGGYCSTFHRRGYTFDAASHFYPLLGNTDSITGRLLRDLGATTGWLKMDPVDQFHFPDGSSFSVPAELADYVARLKAEFPQEATAIDGFFKLVRKLYLLGLLHYFQEIDVPRLERYLDMTVRDALDKFFCSPKLKLLLTADCPHWGSPPNRTSFVFDSMLRLSYFEGNYYPRGGSQCFADELARIFESRGGHILTKSLVRRIVVQRGAAVGIDVETGPRRSRRVVRVAAGTVLSNADMRLTVEQMLPPGTYPDAELAALRRLRPSFPCFLSHIGVRDVPTDLLRRVHGYYWNDWDSDRVGSDSFQCKLFVPTLYEPEMAPPGGHVVIVQKVTDIKYDEISDWQAHKLSIERFVLDHLNRLIPGFDEKVVVCLSASAQTSHRFTLNYHGAMLGWEMSPDQLGRHRPGIEGPVKNLLFVGQWTRPGGGITPVIISAMRAAERVCGRDAVRGRASAAASLPALASQTTSSQPIA